MFGYKRRAIGGGDQPQEVTHHSIGQFPSGEFLQPSPLERGSISTHTHFARLSSASQYPPPRPPFGQQQQVNRSAGAANSSIIVQSGFPSMLSGTFGGGRPHRSSHRSVNVHTYNVRLSKCQTYDDLQIQQSDE